MENQELFNLLDNQSKSLVGILLKRIEILESEQALTPSLYKKIVKESINGLSGYSQAMKTLEAIKTLKKENLLTAPERSAIYNYFIEYVEKKKIANYNNVTFTFQEVK